MDNNVEEEDEMSLLDYRTPKGQLIKLLEKKMKKPEIDDSLGKILDQFSQLTHEQTAFLDGGIFHMNFAEDALLLQSCGLYYGKRVDALWGELLEFHTGMVKYDGVTAKNCTDSNKREERKQELARLEERLNRGKRRKICLTEPDNNPELPKNGSYIFDVDEDLTDELFNGITFPLLEEVEKEADEEPVAPFELDSELLDEWNDIIYINEQEKKRNNNSVLVAQYHRLRYRMKPYTTPTSDEMVYDWSDPDEFNTREGRLISFHHIRHLFDYNDSCLLPDEDCTVGKLRIAYILKKKWLMKNKINPDAPYETYKDAWEQYEKDFFANEKRKIQNMPQRNSEELMKFYKALARKEQIAIQKLEKLRMMGVKVLPVISFENVIVAPVKEGYEGIFDPYIPEDFEDPNPVIDISEEPPLLEGDHEGHEAELSKLLGDMPKHPDRNSETDKPRSDSGFCDASFEGDDCSEAGDRVESAGNTGSDTPFEFDRNPEDKDGSETPNPLDTSADIDDDNHEILENNPEDADNNIETDNPTENGVALNPETIVTDNLEPEVIGEQEINQYDMNLAIREFVKVASSEEELMYRVLENSYFHQTADLTTIIYDKRTALYSHESIEGNQMTVFGCFDKSDGGNQFNGRQEITGVQTTHEKAGNKKRHLEQSTHVDPPPKRRKLSKKQVEKLKKSLISPVKEQKWENFYSLNYQTESGEGEIPRVDYDSASEDEDLFEEDALVEDPVEHLEVDDECCRPESVPLPLTQDSGINMDESFTEDDAIPEHSAPVENHQQIPIPEPSVTGLANVDLLADISKSTGLSREELSQKQYHVDLSNMTPYEQERERVRCRVAEWKEFITPKLKKLEEQEFDIHEYGADIMNRMKVNEQKPFGEIVSGKSCSETIRYFISSLQLANTLNVEICGAKKGGLSNDTFALKLLSKERYHEHFQEYQAPSEETLKDRLKRVKEIREQNKSQTKQPSKRKTEEHQPQSILKSSKTRSTTSHGSQAKRIKILTHNVVRSGNGDPSAFTDQQTVDFQQPSTSWQDRSVEDQESFDAVISDVGRSTHSRISIDSGFMPSCDEDLLEQFDQLQQIGATHSTPIKPRKVSKVPLSSSN